MQEPAFPPKRARRTVERAGAQPGDGTASLRKGGFTHRFRQRLKTYFLTGLVVLLPAIVSIKVFVWLLTYIDDVLRPFLEGFFGKYFFGIGIGISIVLTMVVGLVAQNYLGRKLVGLFQAVFDRLPFIRTVYSVVRQLMEPFSSEEGNSFRHVVMVEYPMKDRYSIGFIANEKVGSIDGDRLVTVFLPSNHLHLGYLVVMPADDVILLDLSVEEALKIIVSCGIVIPKTLDVGEGKPACGDLASVPPVSALPASSDTQSSTPDSEKAPA